MLKGAAKAAYMREYMRRRRAGEPQPKKPRKPWEPSQGLIDRIARAVRHPHRVRGRLAHAIEGLQFDTDEEWTEACYRWKAWTSPPREPAPARKLRCDFCHKPSRRLLASLDDTAHICDQCIEEAAELLRKDALKLVQAQPQGEPLSPREEAMVADVMRQHPALTYERAIYWLRAAGM
jgi:hypothetical protein